MQLFRSKQLALVLFESAANWRVFVGLVSSHVVGIPLVRYDTTPPDSEHRFWITSLRIGIVGSDPSLNHALADPKVKKGALYLIMQGVYDDVDGKFPKSKNPDNNLTIVMPAAIPEHDAAFQFP